MKKDTAREPIELDLGKVQELFASLPRVDFNEVDEMAARLRNLYNETNDDEGDD